MPREVRRGIRKDKTVVKLEVKQQSRKSKTVVAGVRGLGVMLCLSVSVPGWSRPRAPVRQRFRRFA